MLAKMALSKLVKEIDKTELFFRKYQYKASITTIGVYWVRVSKTIEKFNNLVTRRYEEWEAQKDRYPNGWYRAPTRLADHDLFLIENLITLKNNLKDTDTRFRHEHETFSLYTNDQSLIDLLIKHDDRWFIEKANVSPDGVKYFKKNPPAKYRAYMTSNKVKAEFSQEMLEYLNRTPDLIPCKALEEWLHRRSSYRYSHVWLWETHFIDYNDERNLMMLKLMFPEAIGRTYKLEKKP